MSREARAGGDELSARVGELRRLTFMYCDVVGSTELSGRLEPETYRELMRGYRDACREVIESQYDGHIMQLKGDGTLSTFGFPVAHENDAERAVRAGLVLAQAVRDLPVTGAAGEPLDVRVGIHHGPVYLDLDEDDIYGLAANVGARLQALADPGTVVISDDVRRLVEGRFEIESRGPATVRGVAEPLVSFVVVGEREVPEEQPCSTPMVERDEELDRLRQAWSRAAAGAADRATALLVRGEAGLGKSRLVLALANDVREAGGIVVELHGSPFHADAGFHPVRSLVEARCGITDDAGPAERLGCLGDELAGLGLDPVQAVPLLAPVLGIDPSAGYREVAAEGRKLEEQVSRVVLEYLLACTEGRPAMILAENLHWVDDSTRSLLDELVRVAPGRVLVVGTSRNPEELPWEAIDLRPLSLAGRLALIDALTEGVTQEHRMALAARSGGIPLYVEELARAGSVHDPRQAAVVPVPGSVPEVLYEPLVARLYATPDALPVAATAAAAGETVDRSLLAETMSIPAGELDSTLRELVHARILEPVAGRATRYRFRHELLREVAYELQPPSWRRKVHSRLCDLLTRGEPADWHVLASHFERAERPFEAALAYQHTAESARRRGALEEARAHLTRAIELIAPLTDGAARDHREVELRLRRGFLAMSIEGAGSADAAVDFDRCLELTAADPGGDDMFSTLISVWAYYLSRAELDRTRHVSETLRATLATGRDFFRPQNLAGFGMLDWFGGSFGSALDILETAVHDLTERGEGSEIAAVWFVPNDATVAMHAHLGLARYMAADVAGAGDSLDRARTAAAAIDFPQGPWSAAYANWLGSWMWIEAGRVDRADDAVSDIRSSSARHGMETWELVAVTQTAALEGLSALRSDTADPPELMEHAEAIGAFVEIWQTLHLRVFLTFYLTTIGALTAAAGDAAAARRHYEQSLELAAETGMRFYDAETARRLAHLSSDADEVVAQLRGALDLARSQAARPFELRIALDLHELRGEAARSLLEQALRPFGDDGWTSDLETARGRVMARR